MVWPPLSLPWGLLTCQDIPKADATRAIDCPVGDLNDVENSKAHADQSEGQGQEEEQKNCDVEACIELLYQMWEDCRERWYVKVRTWLLSQFQDALIPR